MAIVGMRGFPALGGGAWPGGGAGAGLPALGVNLLHQVNDVFAARSCRTGLLQRAQANMATEGSIDIDTPPRQQGFDMPAASTNMNARLSLRTPLGSDLH